MKRLESHPQFTRIISEITMELETIDFNSPDAPKKFVESLHQTGFGVLSNHPLATSILDRFYAQWLEAFFNQDEEFKAQYAYLQDTQHGFFSSKTSETAKGHTIPDLKEFFQFYPKHKTLPPELEAITKEYFECTNTLAVQLLQWVEEFTPQDIAQHYSQPLSSMIENSENTMLRVLHYPPMTGEEQPGAIRAAAHEDICLLTILPASNEPGLQVLGNDGKWIDVPCNFGHLIINIGDMLQEASNGYFPSTTHRVINPTGKRSNTSRVSLPLFLHPKNDVVLSSRYTSQSFLTERLTELGLLS